MAKAFLSKEVLVKCENHLIYKFKNIRYAHTKWVLWVSYCTLKKWEDFDGLKQGTAGCKQKCHKTFARKEGKNIGYDD